jgi:hypothetical protein
MSGEGHGHRWLGILVLMMVVMLVLGLSAMRHLLQVLLDLAGQRIVPSRCRRRYQFVTVTNKSLRFLGTLPSEANGQGLFSACGPPAPRRPHGWLG